MQQDDQQEVFINPGESLQGSNQIEIEFYDTIIPMMKVATKENRYASAFPRNVTFLPKYRISRGAVMNLTIIRVDMNTAICTKPAHVLSSWVTILPWERKRYRI